MAESARRRRESAVYTAIATDGCTALNCAGGQDSKHTHYRRAKKNRRGRASPPVFPCGSQGFSCRKELFRALDRRVGRAHEVLRLVGAAAAGPLRDLRERAQRPRAIDLAVGAV